MAVLQSLPSFSDNTDFENASRGLVGTLKPCAIKNTAGRVIWNNDDYDFMQGKCPATADPKLWRQGQLCSMQGLFKVTEGIYQVRGFDLSNITFVEGSSGIVVIDPLTSVECAAAALQLYRSHRGDRPVKALIYSHSHADHFGGARGILAASADPSIPVIAPEGFMEEATSENIYLGDAMRRRAAYMYGIRLPRAADGQIGCGLGMAVSNGITSLIPPNVTIYETGETRTIDGVRIEFQMVPGTEAPAEMNFFFPDHNALLIAECATHCLHNIVTLRGALVRDAKAWASYLDETLVLYGDRSDVLFASHHWPTWGKEQLKTFMEEQRDLYAYLHDQTIRMMNLGMTGTEIAEKITLPPSLEAAWHGRGYYGSISHNVKGIYQRYMGWFDGDPVHLWEYPTAELGQRYVDCMGGVDAVVQKAAHYAETKDLRFAATLLGHAVSAKPTHRAARLALASVFDKLGFGCENATWRNFYLTGAMDMRSSLTESPKAQPSFEISGQLSTEELLTLLSVRLDGLRAATESFVMDLHLTDEKKRLRLILKNGVLTVRNTVEQTGFAGDAAGLTMTLTKAEFVAVLNGQADASGKSVGDVRIMAKLVELTNPVKKVASSL
ncbi:beta-lactamase domain-containing protein [Penicillium riverlandense]|uniref:beta-lactamase domain-containing protein n=1 Tax=Penicillium riverlandense TaxID=1903569 RepID=UPI002547D2BC|nr:beta-lactamase domain-containing protein [Penicillium riverlandense]KAJ5811970.1 beta-lactamase domain-containing protein [Penicillium riverlandense]